MTGKHDPNQLINNASPIMSDTIFLSFRELIYQNTGIYYQDNKKYLLENRLLKRTRFLEISNFQDYYHLLLNKTNFEKEKRYLFEAITINETYFFRNQPQYDACLTSVFPELINEKLKTGSKKIKIWSAASSSGEEAYTLSILIKDLLISKYPNIEFEIIGSDISEAMIQIAKSGAYKEYAIRNTPPYYLKKYFHQKDNYYLLNESVKKMVTFKNINLYDDAAIRAINNCDIIFCANVLIYFDAKSKTKVVSKLYDSLNKGGYLFIGYSETLHNISKAFSLVSFPKTIGYKKEN